MQEFTHHLKCIAESCTLHKMVVGLNMLLSYKKESVNYPWVIFELCGVYKFCVHMIHLKEPPQTKLLVLHFGYLELLNVSFVMQDLSFIFSFLLTIKCGTAFG